MTSHAQGPLTLDPMGRSVPVGSTPMGPPPPNGYIRRKNERPVCAKPVNRRKMCNGCIAHQNKRTKAKNPLAAKKLSEKVKTRRENLSHKTTFNQIEEFNAANELREILAENEATQKEIRQKHAELNYLKAIKAQVQCLHQCPLQCQCQLSTP